MDRTQQDASGYPRVGASTREGLDEQQRALHDAFTSGDRAARGTDFSLVDAHGGLIGPPSAWLLSPGLGAALEPLGHAVRFELSIPARAKEIAILRVAAAERSAFERYAHTRAGRAAGLSDAEIERLLADAPLDADDPVEHAVDELSRALLTGQPLADADFERAERALGRRAVFEVVTLVGYYRMIALQLRAFDIRPPQ